MRVFVNGKPIEALTPRYERPLSLRRAREPVVEGSVLSAEAAIATAVGGMKLLYGALCVIAGVMILLPVAITAVRKPDALILVGPIVLATIAVIVFTLLFFYRRDRDKTERRIAASAPRMAPAGTPIRLDQVGLAVGGNSFAWPDLQIAEVSITRSYNNEAMVSYLEVLTLAAHGREVVLDVKLIANGRLLVDQIWRNLRPAKPR